MITRQKPKSAKRPELQVGAGWRRAVNAARATRGLKPLPEPKAPYQFAEGRRRWRVKLTDENRNRHGYPFDFVILGPAPNSVGKMDGKWKRCRLESFGHTEKCHNTCHHGIESVYPVTHIKKCAELVLLSSETAAAPTAEVA